MALLIKESGGKHNAFKKPELGKRLRSFGAQLEAFREGDWPELKLSDD